ncbi:hypothetical protein [Lentibacillus sp. CBA3610]|uniref:hypothetical protein n=1 Tax=Lentibacillus sp. CBA3610 TaxID=2518176 RepID=UPI00159540F5|nr:hypothetical protein [Lentibacillus sp. CBA3610]QKY70198.1 hypothetical protein Len3610_11880 [Lentibacillus sp. CBA3610]
MKQLTYIILNFLLLLIIGREVFIDFENIKNQITEMIIAALIVIAIMNFLLLLSEKISEKIYNWHLIRKTNQSNMLDWLGEEHWLNLHERLLKIKNFNETALIKNFGSVKKEIKKEFNTKEKLEMLRIYLEGRVESPKLKTINIVTYTILIAVITSSIVPLINGLLEFNSTASYIYLIILAIVWLLLLASISSISKEIDKNRVLLKLVIHCIDESVDCNSFSDSE